MFTFTFYHFDSMDKMVVAGHKYHVEGKNGYAVVSVFARPGEDGECYYVYAPDYPAHDSKDYRSVFITNESGKTIDRIAPQDYDASPIEPAVAA